MDLACGTGLTARPHPLARPREVAVREGTAATAVAAGALVIRYRTVMVGRPAAVSRIKPPIPTVPVGSRPETMTVPAVSAARRPLARVVPAITARVGVAAP